MWLHCLVDDILQGLCPKRSGAGCGCDCLVDDVLQGVCPKKSGAGCGCTVWFMMFCRGCVPRDQVPGVVALFGL